jgi:hypothetical protein
MRPCRLRSCPSVVRAPSVLAGTSRTPPLPLPPLSRPPAASQYLRHADRGILLFGATITVIRNGRVVEAPFDVQHEVITLGEPGVTIPSTNCATASAARNSTGHTVAAQVRAMCACALLCLSQTLPESDAQAPLRALTCVASKSV